MFYTDQHSGALRFGDVVSGYILATPRIKQPVLEHGNHEYNVEIELSQQSVILSPSCSIGDKKILIAPLRKIWPAFFDNEYLLKDLTRLNRKMERRFTHSPSAITKMDDKKKAIELTSEIVWAFVDLFIYEKNEKLPPYTITRRQNSQEIRYYMIDFRDATKVNCDLIVNAEKSPQNCKILELSDATRLELSEKIQYFYKRA